MKRIRDKVAGLDVHRDTVVARCRVVEPDGEVTVAKDTFATTRKGLGDLAGWLTDAGVTTVVMESTGVYWRAVYYSLEGLFSEVWLCNAQHVKNVPGRKTDLSDAEWLADVAAHGMVRPSFVPAPEIRELRELTRYRKTQVEGRAREIQRLEKVLQDAGLKWTSVASTVWGVSSRQVIEALIAGERDPKVRAEMAKGRLRPKIAQLEEALSGHFGAHHAVVCRQVIDHIDFLDRSIAKLSEEVTARLVPFEAAVAVICSVPGISKTTAEVIVAETGAHQRQLLLRPLQPCRPPQRPQQGGRRRGELHAGHHLASAVHRRLLRRSRRRLLPATPRPRHRSQTARGAHRIPRLHRHHDRKGGIAPHTTDNWGSSRAKSKASSRAPTSLTGLRHFTLGRCEAVTSWSGVRAW
ncbi:MAG: IS110 family transposase [Actinomycetota bacterium]|nr:IS110 family transposase [Actinomycetota bacterium]